MTTCNDIRVQCYPYLDDALEADEAASVREHLEVCPACEREFEQQATILAWVAESGREAAPDPLRQRVRAMLGAQQADQQVAEGGTGRVMRLADWRKRILVPLAAAAAIALLVVTVPSGDRGVSLMAAQEFAADHAFHAVELPSLSPFEDGVTVPDAPILNAGHVEGVSKCRIDNRDYAHYSYGIEGSHVSVYIPMDGKPVMGGDMSVDGARVLPVGTGVLVSDDVDAGTLEHLWPATG